MKRKYKDAMLQRVYDGFIAAAADPTSFLYYKGEPRRGSATRAAFWNGFEGIKATYTIRNTQGHAAYMAGRDYKQTLSPYTE